MRVQLAQAGEQLDHVGALHGHGACCGKCPVVPAKAGTQWLSDVQGAKALDASVRWHDVAGVVWPFAVTDPYPVVLPGRAPARPALDCWLR
ncbi:MAG: hypothetical protein EPN68_03795 [Rhodanobacter sp.]|nr:MAG: hypothetical protein EPN68_03795 [Rhodanobacter sp.]